MSDATCRDLGEQGSSNRKIGREFVWAVYAKWIGFDQWVTSNDCTKSNAYGFEKQEIVIERRNSFANNSFHEMIWMRCDCKSDRDCGSAKGNESMNMNGIGIESLCK